MVGTAVMKCFNTLKIMYKRKPQIQKDVPTAALEEITVKNV